MIIKEKNHYLKRNAGIDEEDFEYIETPIGFIATADINTDTIYNILAENPEMIEPYLKGASLNRENLEHIFSDEFQAK
jgi:hypothetical protein